ncbi:DUF1003 domain-containing protein [Sphingomonas sp. LHG3406-1]|uniref:DUF1003 domain-containing protein n=1 Tax=Sphingomonas sp. LHG3406-1 TaxID=2804617 RepID=UPI002610C47F|nr:DUF1003 domain-containing protein [Sphingomonas sp. LHG3406-1]
MSPSQADESTRPTPTVRPEDGLASALTRNIAALAERRQAEEARAGTDQRVARAITRFAGSMVFVWLHVTLVVGWIAINLGWTPLRPFDPTFVILATFASVEAIFISTFILIAQNRAAEVADRRASLDLQISLLSEHEVTQLIRLVTRIADHLGIEEASDPELAELQRTVAPEAVLERIEEAEEE